MSHGVTYLVIANVGQSVARNVEITFDPALPNYEKTPDGQPGVVAPILGRRFARPIGILAPGQRLKNIYSHLAVGVEGNIEPVPEKFTVNVRYTDDRARSYQDSFPLDQGLIGLETQSNPSDTNDSEKRRNKALEAIVWELWE